MAPLSQGIAALGRRIIEQEADGSTHSSASADAVEAACRKLRDHLITLLGAGGVSALLKRALHLAQREQPLLANVALSEEPPACLTSLTESLAASTDEEAAAAVAAILSHMLGLLVMLLGEDLGMKPIRKLWPQATSVREIDE